MKIGPENKLALHGGEKTVVSDQADMFTWPIVTAEHEQAVLKVLRDRNMSGLDITREFEQQYAQRLGRTYALACPNGTAAIQEALFGLGVGVGDEVIAPGMTYWATLTQLYSLGATPVFAEVDPETLCLDYRDIEHRITNRTKAIIVVHYSGMPADMDAILDIAGRHHLKVLEDCSHAHGSLYKGRQVGTFGDAAAMSLMTGKLFAIGEGGIWFTDDRKVHERGLLFGHYIRHREMTLDELKRFAGVPCGGVKNRMNQFGSALGLVQLKYMPEQMAEIDRAMNYFADLLEDTPGVRPIRPVKGSGSTRGGWYFPLFRFISKDIGHLSLITFSKAVRAEGSSCNPGANKPLHQHPLFTEMDVYGHGRPTRIAHLDPLVSIEAYQQSLPVSEMLYRQVFEVPWFKHYRPMIIEEHARAYKKVIDNYQILLADDHEDDERIGGYSSYFTDTRGRR